jgi:hypothetical protein
LVDPGTSTDSRLQDYSCSWSVLLPKYLCPCLFFSVYLLAELAPRLCLLSRGSLGVISGGFLPGPVSRPCACPSFTHAIPTQSRAFP